MICATRTAHNTFPTIQPTSMLCCGKITILLPRSCEEKKWRNSYVYKAYLERLKSCAVYDQLSMETNKLPYSRWFRTTAANSIHSFSPRFFLRYFPFSLPFFFWLLSLIHWHSHKIVRIYLFPSQSARHRWFVHNEWISEIDTGFLIPLYAAFSH